MLSLVGGAFLFDFRISGFQLYGFRIVVLISLLILIIQRNLVFSTGTLSKYVTWFFVVWIAYALISISWCPDIQNAIKEIFYIAFGFGVYLTLLSLKNKWTNFKIDFFNAWIMTLILVIIVSLWEIYTGKHLEGSLQNTLNNLGAFHGLHNTPVFTFDNPNHYAIYISVSVCILLYLLLLKKYAQFMALLLPICFFLLIIVSSRLAILFFGFAAILYLLVRFKHYKIGNHFIRNSIAFVAMGSILYLGIYGFHDTTRVHSDLKEKLILTNKVETPFADSLLLYYSTENSGIEIERNTVVIEPKQSISVRKNLIYNGLEFTKNSGLMGVGAGGFRSLMQGKAAYPTEGIHTPHNYVIEILSQYGIIIFLLFCFIFIYIFYILWHSYKKIGFTHDHFLTVILVFCFLLMSNANSSFLPLPINWIMFALIILFAEGLSEKSTIENAGEN